ncbi:MAG TPA: hypothetical protein PKC28_11220 [Bdellovibrionales bacterium]|nr:hypothetical protein [Bdellovibrionales bacterium]
MQHLIVVDDRHIRKSAFARVNRLLKKLQRLDANVTGFYDRDQKLFGEWDALTFRERCQTLERLRGEYLRLAEWHNWILAISEMEDLSPREAALFLRDEERRYVSGNEFERRHIEELRRLRDQYIRSAGDRQHRRHRRRQEREEAEMAQSRGRGTPDVSDLEEFENLMELSDQELEDCCSDQGVAFAILGLALRVGDFRRDFSGFFRAWDLVHPKIQTRFQKDFKAQTGRDLMQALGKIRTEPEPESKAASAESRGPGDEDPGRPSAIEAFKLLYRKIVRKLHPDMQGEKDRDAIWRGKMWLRTQKAYKEEDTRELNKIYQMILLRGDELNELRVSDLHITHDWLSDEIDMTENQIRGLRSQPAWGFSRRKDFAPLRRKIDKKLERDEQTLRLEIEDLRLHHERLINPSAY